MKRNGVSVASIIRWQQSIKRSPRRDQIYGRGEEEAEEKEKEERLECFRCTLRAMREDRMVRVQDCEIARRSSNRGVTTIIKPIKEKVSIE